MSDRYTLNLDGRAHEVVVDDDEQTVPEVYTRATVSTPDGFAVSEHSRYAASALLMACARAARITNTSEVSLVPAGYVVIDPQTAAAFAGVLDAVIRRLDASSAPPIGMPMLMELRALLRGDGCTTPR